MEGAGDQFVLALHGDIDIAAVAEIEASGGLDVAAATTAVTVDLGEVTFIDSTGLGLLVTLHKRAPHGIRLRNVPNNAAKVLELTGLSDVLPSED